MIKKGSEENRKERFLGSGDVVKFAFQNQIQVISGNTQNRRKRKRDDSRNYTENKNEKSNTSDISVTD